MNHKEKFLSAALTVLMLFLSSAIAETVRFAVVSDTQGKNDVRVNTRVFGDIVQAIADHQPSVQFVIVTGDLVNGTHDDAQMAVDYQLWRQIAAPWYESDFVGAKVYPLPGNHDQITDNCLSIWQSAFPELPENGPSDNLKMTYSFDVGPCHFALVNNEYPTMRHLVNMDWLEADLSGSEKPVKFVFGHDPAFPVGLHSGTSLDAYPEDRDAFWSLLMSQGVQAYFCGHEHTFDHWMKDGVHQLIGGGGGGPGLYYHYMIVEADENDVRVTVYNQVDHQVRESFLLSDTENVAQENRDESRIHLDLILDSLPCSFIAVLIFGFFFTAQHGLVRFHK
jgi:predicted phosphodiesterase